MDCEFTAEPKRLGDLFGSETQFAVPSFQRPYSWTTEEAGQLLTDILEALETDGEEPSRKQYFLGSIVLISPGSSDRHGRDADSQRDWLVIDGHQRLVTLTILFAALRDLAIDDGGNSEPFHALIHAANDNPSFPWPFRLKLRGGDGEFFRSHVQETGACHVMPDADSEDMPLAHRKIIANREWLLDDLAQLSPDQRLRLFNFVVERCHVVVIATPTMDSAYRLFTVLNNRGRELARDDILKAELIGGIPSAEQGRYTQLWDAAAKQLGQQFENLFSHIRSIYGQAKAPVISEVLKIAREQGGAARFLEATFQPLARIYADIINPDHGASGSTPEVRRYLTYLSWLRSQDWLPAALLWMHEHGGDPQRTAEFLRRLDRLTYGLNLLALGSDKRISRQRAVVAAIHEGTVLDPNETVFTLDRDEQRTILHNLSRNAHRRSQQVCKQVLLRLNDDLSGRLVGLEPGDYSVEHVLPVHPPRNSVWSQWFADADEREFCTHCLGNLVIVPQAQNEAAGNKGYDDKRRIYFEDGFDDRLAITAMLRDTPEWRAPQVLERNELLMERLRSIWRLDGPAAQKGARQDAAPSSRQLQRRNR